MSKQEHSMLNRGPGKSWPKALDEPRWMPEDEQSTDESPVQDAQLSAAKPLSRTPIVVQNPSTLDLARLITVIIINFKTRNLLKRAYKSFRAVYPDVPMIIADNGSKDTSTDLVRELGTRHHVRSMIITRNIGHGPAMNKAIQQADTPYIFTLDTDTETIKGGFLEEMIGKMRADNSLYAIGWHRWVERVSGVPHSWDTKNPPKNKKKFVQYIHPSAALYRTSMYHTLAPFFHHGAPCLDNMREAEKRELKLSSFPIRKYITHLEAGTRRMYSGRWNPTEKTPRKKWKVKDRYPI